MKKINITPQEHISYLDVPDFYDDITFLTVETNYSELIGRLLVDFSYLEHLINCMIAEFINKEDFNNGYTILETLNFNQKIDLFYKFYLTLFSQEKQLLRSELVELKNELIRIKTFRNNVVHANWQTLDSRCYVRTKILTDHDFGRVIFKNIKITPIMIKSNLSRIGILIDKILDFADKVNKS